MLIGISGYIGSGKDTIACMLTAILHQQKKQCKTVRFADKLKDILCLLSGCTREQLEDRDFKESIMPVEWTRKVYDQVWNDTFDAPAMTYRQALQFIGTELFRDRFHPDTWVNATMNGYKPAIQLREEYFQGESILAGMIEPKETWPNWILPDVRFPNEAQAILKAGGLLLRVNRPNLGGEVPIHASETGLDYFKGFHIIIRNDGSLEDLARTVKHVAEHFKLIDHADTNTPFREAL